MSHAIRDWISLMGMNSGVRNSITAGQLSLNCCLQERSSIVQRALPAFPWNGTGIGGIKNLPMGYCPLFEYECVASRDCFLNEKYAV